jgi:Zn-dependent metalloprotease
VPEKTPFGCVMDWDATYYTSTVPHCLRRIDGNKHYPEDLVGEVHADGVIWSRALYDIHNALGHVVADTIIVNGSMNFTGTTMTQLATATVAAAQRIYGKALAAPIPGPVEQRGHLPEEEA